MRYHISSEKWSEWSTTYHKRVSAAGKPDTARSSSLTLNLNYHARPLLDFAQRYAWLNPILSLLSTKHAIIGGLVLWSRSFTPTAAQVVSNPATSPVNSLIREVLIEGRSGEDKYEKDGYAIRWTFVNELELIFVVSILSFLHHIPLNSHCLPLGCISAYPTAHIRRRPSNRHQSSFC